jgi:ABC-type transporter Mla subunit MlaD
MSGWQFPGVPSVPSMADALRLMQVQAEVMRDLPETLSELSKAVRGLAETAEATRETVSAANRVVERVESLVDELQDPVRGLRPGIERLIQVLDSPVLERLPSVLEEVESAVLPLTRSAERTRHRLAWANDQRRRAVDQIRKVTSTSTDES